MQQFQQYEQIATNRIQQLITNQILQKTFIHETDRQNKINLQQNQSTQSLIQQLQQRYVEISHRINQANQEKDAMMQLFDKIQKFQKGEGTQIKKRHRRKNKDIQAKYQCTVHICRKMYTSSTSLARHMKLKHCSIKLQPPQPSYKQPPDPNLINQSLQLSSCQLDQVSISCSNQPQTNVHKQVPNQTSL